MGEGAQDMVGVAGGFIKRARAWVSRSQRHMQSPIRCRRAVAEEHGKDCGSGESVWQAMGNVHWAMRGGGRGIDASMRVRVLGVGLLSFSWPVPGEVTKA
jgi:hypothetical protein